MNLSRPPNQPDRRAEDQPGEIPIPRPMIPILPEAEAILQPPMDNTPNDAPGSEVPARIPHLGHALLFLALTFALLLLAELTALGLTHTPAKTAAAQAHQAIGSQTANPAKLTDSIPPRLIIAAEAATYIASLATSWFLFPILWRRSFAQGIQLNTPAATRNALRLIPIGITISFVVQALSLLITKPKSIPMDDFFRSPLDVWLITAFGILLAPLFEEIAFRGFLLPAFAIAYDWLSLPRIPAAREQWDSSNALSLPAFAFSAVLTSILFALLHGQQTGYTWPVLLLLCCVSLVLTAIRIRLRSVFASTLVHASYNFAIFLTTFIATGGYRHLDKLTH